MTGSGEAKGTNWLLTIQLSAEPAAVRLVRKLLANAARIEGASELEAHQIEVAVGEALAQGVSFRGHDGADSVTVSAKLRAGRFIGSFAWNHVAARSISVRDGRGDEGVLGWGLLVIAQVVDEVEIREPFKSGQMPRLRLVKRIG